MPMGVLSEQMAKDRNISRAEQDKFAADSYQKAIKAQKEGLFDQEIEPLKVKFMDPKTEEEKEITVSRDDGVREVTAESLGKIKPAFAKDGSIHAGNASQISDEAAAVLLMKRSTAERLGQKILGKYVAASVVGVPPLLMGVGPWKAIPVALQKAGISAEDVDIFEINEAFASQCLWCANELKLPMEKINPKGQSILTLCRLLTNGPADGVFFETHRWCHRLWSSSRLHRRTAGLDAALRAQANGQESRRQLDVRRNRYVCPQTSNLLSSPETSG